MPYTYGRPLFSQAIRSKSVVFLDLKTSLSLAEASVKAQVHAQTKTAHTEFKGVLDFSANAKMKGGVDLKANFNMAANIDKISGVHMEVKVDAGFSVAPTDSTGLFPNFLCLSVRLLV